jgi:SOS-response transcriptional repressor LexA
MQIEPKHRLQEARANAGFESPSDAARAFREINQNTLISHENGNRKISKGAAERYGKAFGVEPGWILFGERKDMEFTGVIRVPMVSMVSASGLREQPGVTAADIERWIEVADMPAGDWIALGVEGDSMNRIAPDGATLLVNRADDKLVDGRFYIFSLEEGQATFKRYKRKPVESIQPYSTNPDHLSIPVDGDLYVFGRVRRILIDV